MEAEKNCLACTWEIKNFSVLSSEEVFCVWGPAFETEDNKWWRTIAFIDNSEKITFGLWSLSKNSKLDTWKAFIRSTGGDIPLEYDDDGEVFTFNKTAIFSDNQNSMLPQDTLTVCYRIKNQKIKSEKKICTVIRKYSVDIDFTNLDKMTTVHENDRLSIVARLSDNLGNESYKFNVWLMPMRNQFSPIVKCNLFVTGNRARVVSQTETNVPFRFSDEWTIKVSKDANLHLHLDVLVADQENACFCTLKDDFVQLYKKGTLNDATLNCQGLPLAAHRNILAARSPVFRAMFEDDHTTEGRSGVVDIDDLDGGTVDRMLAFLYGDSLDDLEWEGATKLYYAADKYAVPSMRSRCVDVLLAGLQESNVCELLKLADLHADGMLMNDAVDFIKDHEGVLSSDDWIKLEDSHPRIAAKAMREVFFNKGKQTKQN